MHLTAIRNENKEKAINHKATAEAIWEAIVFFHFFWFFFYLFFFLVSQLLIFKVIINWSYIWSTLDVCLVDALCFCFYCLFDNPSGQQLPTLGWDEVVNSQAHPSSVYTNKYISLRKRCYEDITMNLCRCGYIRRSGLRQ